jgi:putative transposase
VSCPPTLSPAKLVQYIKGVSSRKLQEEFAHLKKRYWGQHVWARGYFCASVGAIEQDQIKAYIEHHQAQPPDDTFRIDE